MAEIKLKDDQGLRAIEITQEEMLNLKPSLREFGAITRKRAADWVESQGEGTWAPPAASTKKRWESTGTSQISKRGTVRAVVLQRLEKRVARLQESLQKNGYSQRNRDQLTKTLVRIQRLKKQEQSSQKKAYGKRKIGKRQSEKRTRLMPKMAGTIRAGVSQRGENYVIRWYSKADEVAAAQEEGEGKGGSRRGRIILDESVIHEDELADMVTDALVRAWESA